MSGPVRAPLTVETIDGLTVGRPITTIKVSNGSLTVSGSTATLTTGGGGGGSGTVTSIATTSPITGGTITTTGTIGISQADTTTDGFLSSTDWNTFNGKQGAITLTTTGTSGTATLVGSTLNIPNYSNSATIGGTIANTQVAYGSATDAIQGSANMTFDGTNLSVGGYVKSGGVYDTTGATDLTLKTNGGTDSGTLTLKNGSGGNLVFDPTGAGLLQIEGTTNPGAIKLMCEAGTHGITIESAPHSASADYKLVLPDALPADASNKYLVSDTSGNLSFTTASGGSVSFPLEGTDGSAGAPTYTFSSDTNTGIFRLAGDTLGITTGGVARIYVQNTKTEFNYKLEVPVGSAGSPAITFPSDNDTGIYRPAADSVGFTVGGNERMRVQNNKVTGIAFSATGTGTEAAPTLIPDDSNATTGIYSGTANQIDFAFDGSNKISFGSAGEIYAGGSSGSTGTSGQVLTSGGSGSAVTWASAGGGGSEVKAVMPQLGNADSTEQYMWAHKSFPFGTGGDNLTTQSLGTQQPLCVPFIARRNDTLDTITAQISTGTSPNATTIDLGVYTDNGAGWPETLLGKASGISVNSSGQVTGTLSAEAGQSLTTTAGTQYWLAIVIASGSGSPVLAATDKDDIPGFIWRTQYNAVYGVVSMTGSDNALPSTFATTTGFSYNALALGVRY